MHYKIYPPIGIARVGKSQDQFYIGPEIPGHPGLELGQSGNETKIINYKDATFRHKRQAARFRIFEFEDNDSGGHLFELPDGAEITWKVRLANIKAGVMRPTNPPSSPMRPVLAAGAGDRRITPDEQKISGAMASGKVFDTGEFLGDTVNLGELRTDAKQNLLVLGGKGKSDSPTNPPSNLTNFYTNPGWYDDVSDGTVTAMVQLPDGTVVIEEHDIEPAWVIVAPPAFAPEVNGVVTLYDIMLQVGIDHLSVPGVVRPSFTHDVYPLIKRANALQWVHDDNDPHNTSDEEWATISTDWPSLADPTGAASALREETRDKIEEVEFSLRRFRLTKNQSLVLNKWADGEFDGDWTGEPAVDTHVSAMGMTRAALDGCVGQGFFPGIEAGIIVKDHTLYTSPFDFRFDHNRLNPGEVTALMAVPWQADFLDCREDWWPTQRPDKARLSVSAPDSKRWARGIGSYQDMVTNYWRLGVVQADKDAAGEEVFVEKGRDPGFPETPNNF